MRLDDIPKCLVLAEEDSVPRHEANDAISHSVPSSETVEELFSYSRSPGVVVLAGHAKSFQLALDQEFAKGVEARRVELDPDLRCA